MFSAVSVGFTGISQPYRIDIFEDYIYGTGLKHEVFKIHKYGKQSVEYLNLGMEKPTNALISHRYKQQDGKLFWQSLFVYVLCKKYPFYIQKAPYYLTYCWVSAEECLGRLIY